VNDIGPWAARLRVTLLRNAREGAHAIVRLALVLTAMIAVKVLWIGPVMVAIEVTYWLTRRRDVLWARALSKFLLPFALATPGVALLQFLQNQGAFSAHQTVAIESACRDANDLLKDVADLSFLRASALLLAAVLLELLAPRWKVVSGYLGVTKGVAFVSGILAAFSCFTFTTSKEFHGDINALKTTLQARLGSEKGEHLNVKIHERELSAQQAAIRQNLERLLKARAVNAAIQARVDNSTPDLEPDFVRDPDYGKVVVKLAKSQVKEFLSRRLADFVFGPAAPESGHPKTPDPAAGTEALVDGLPAPRAAGRGAALPRVDLIDDVEVLQGAVDREGAALADEKKAEDQIQKALEEESGSVFDKMIDPFKDRLKGLVETLCAADNDVIRKAAGDLAGNYLDEYLDKAKERLSGRATAGLRKALAPVDGIAARAYVSGEVGKTHTLYDADLRAEIAKADSDYDKWAKGAVTDEVMKSDLEDLRMAFIRDGLTQPAADASIFERAQVLRPLEANLVKIERDWTPKLERAQKVIEANEEAAEKEREDKLKEVEEREEHAVEHPEAHPI